MRATMITVAAALVGTAALASAGAAQSLLRPGATLESQGVWHRDGATSRASQRWHVRLQRLADNLIVGVVRVEGSPLLRDGRVEGRVVGTAVTARILDAEGNVVANLTGEVRADGSMHGVYVDRTGETGKWHWSGSTSHENLDARELQPLVAD
ncbi:MAG: hypothetical protein KatS3mg015_2562 [Fimbriimonadales bacterium]|nr:MAG: hypothetical protein KatS3mg015_2562 [Fimbriimonadales bacterium]